VVTSIRKWESGEGGPSTGDRRGGAGGGMNFVADELMKAAKVIATDPFAESPFMEHAVEEGLAMEGGLFFSFVLFFMKPTRGYALMNL
jgi:protein phosphatase PTC7